MGFASLLLDDNVIPDSDPKRSGIASEKSKMHRKIRIIACTPSPRMALGVGLARPMSRNICWLCLTGFGSPWRYHVSKQFTICYKRIHSVLKTESRNERGTRTGDGEDRLTKHALRATGSGNLLIALKADIVVRASTADAAIRPHVLEARCVAKDTASKCYHEANAHAAL